MTQARPPRISSPATPSALADAVRFFHIDALSSSVGFKVDFDMVLLVLASGLYRLMARRMRGYDDAQARQISRSHRHAGRSRHHRERNHGAIPSPCPSSHCSRLRAVPCRRVLHGWVYAETMRPVDVHPTHWQPWPLPELPHRALSHWRSAIPAGNRWHSSPQLHG
jgi:hypothetical protein